MGATRPFPLLNPWAAFQFLPHQHPTRSLPICLLLSPTPATSCSPQSTSQSTTLTSLALASQPDLLSVGLGQTPLPALALPRLCRLSSPVGQGQSGLDKWTDFPGCGLEQAELGRRGPCPPLQELKDPTSLGSWFYGLWLGIGAHTPQTRTYTAINTENPRDLGQKLDMITRDRTACSRGTRKQGRAQTGVQTRKQGPEAHQV